MSAQRVFMKGNEAACEGAFRAGCKFFAGYPITPQNEVPEYMSKHIWDHGGTFIQSESEVAAINMLMGASAAGARAMTSSSSPGISLKQEGISYIAMSELPCVVMNVVRCGPGLGNIAPHQGDYFQATRGGGHGDYRTITLAPNSVQEMAQFVYLAFELADKWRNPALVLSDGTIGQMMEPVDFSEMPYVEPPDKSDWCLNAHQEGRERHLITTIYLLAEDMAPVHERLVKKYERIKKAEVRYTDYMSDDAEILIVAIGSPSRVARSAIKAGREEGLKLGLLRPITVWPFPYGVIRQYAESDRVKAIVVTEMNWGQMVEDVAMAVSGKKPVHFVPKHGGLTFTPEDMLEPIRAIRENPMNPETLWVQT
ncbi:MAG: 3-methyl-2-oxobutanoate dehydrogenase subunit VorB [Planctomycetales bacterium 4484_113]|nr:MAG: 3-methyl-2-oxobutanoate dehydrogenase subunit VorB [Planctomycetales bacterium 4484_113]